MNDGRNICVPGQGYKYNFPDNFVEKFICWVKEIIKRGYHGDPNQFEKFERYDGIS